MIDSQALVALQVGIGRALILSKLCQCSRDDLEDSEQDELSWMLIDVLSKVDTDLSAVLSTDMVPVQKVRHG
ncbi:hypothetical protein [Achromobacter veterisilvae]|nr:hypothetical protein [Achromobacter veterisilvae]